MIVYVRGTDRFLARQAIQQIKEKYLAKNPTGGELIEVDPTLLPNWADLQAVPLFATTRLVVIREASALPPSAQTALGHFLTDLPESTVVVIWDGGTIKDLSLQKALAGVKTITADPLSPRQLYSWVKKRSSELSVELEPAVIEELASSNDLWAIETELLRLSSAEEVVLTTTSAETAEPFIIFRLVRAGRWQQLAEQLAQDAIRGVPIELTIGGLASAIRKEISNPELKAQLTDLLMDIDMGVKTGYLDTQAAAALLAAHLPNPGQERVRWEESWLEGH